MTRQAIDVDDLCNIIRQLRELATQKMNETHTSDYHEVAILGEALGMERTIRLLEEALAARGITEAKQ